MRAFAWILLFALFCARAFCGDSGYGLSLYKSYAQRGTISFPGAEIPIAVYVARTSGGGRAMAVDGGGTLIKAKFSADGRTEEIFVSGLMPGGEAAGRLAADAFRLALGLFGSVRSGELRSLSEGGLPRFAETENVRVEFSDYKKEKSFSAPQTLKISAGCAKIALRLSASETEPEK